MTINTTTSPTVPPPITTVHFLRRRHFNRLFATIYTLALLSHFYHHIHALLFHPKNLTSLLITLTLLISDIVLAYMWSTTQAVRMNPIHRKVYPENLNTVTEFENFPALDVFICTADPYKEPPIGVTNTALSVMAYDYPTEKISVYVSDDGGSEMTMFAFMEAAKFSKVWLPFCKENNVVDRCPEAYFESNNCDSSSKTAEIQMMYESMKMKVEKAVENGKVNDEYISSEDQLQILSQYRNKNFTRQNHPSVIQVILDSKKDEDITGGKLPNLIYVSREKSKSSPHHFKAGALNALLRVSGALTNSPVILTLDCDMYSNDPTTPRRALCCLMDKSIKPNCGYVQFPQRYHGINKNDIYACEHKRLFVINSIGFDGLNGPNYVGTGCFFSRRTFFGSPSSYIEPEMIELSPSHVVDKPITDPGLLGLADHVAGCKYENHNTLWGSKIGFRYGSLVEDYYTGFLLHCEGWHSIFCNPDRPAFLGDVPTSLNDALGQCKRWSVGLCEVGFSKFSPITYGVKSMGILMGQAYAHYAFWPTWSLPLTFYAFVPSLALLNGVPIFTRVNDLWFLLYIFLFLGAYGQDCIDFMLEDGTLGRWWSDQRMWLIRGLTSHVFGPIEYLAKRLGIPTPGFNITSKVSDEELSKRYEQGIFEFGIASPMFVPLTSAAILNLIAFVIGLVRIFRDQGTLDAFFVQIFIAGFGVLNSLPFYEAIALRSDRGKIPTKTTITSFLIVGFLYGISSSVMNM